ncbi:MAG: MATE family efflux transporter [Clostridia bacterium]|nr:MATE family efflux transporter [Clostridia bacterium]MDE7328929.1 MATE family efflux transporter [Clostridia bacterium]
MATKDMSVGKPLKVLYAFAVPMIISVLFQQFYNIADSIIAGNFINDGGEALAAVNAAYPVTVVFIAIGNGFGVGGGVVISRIFGSKNYPRAKTAVRTALINIAFFSVIFTLLGALTNKPLLTLMNSQDLGENVFTQSVDYLNIYVYGLSFLFIYNVVSAIFQALGNSKTPLFLLIFSTLFNVVIDVVFVKYFDLGVKGLAWGTFVAQGIASVISLIILLANVNKLPKTDESTEYADMSQSEKVYAKTSMESTNNEQENTPAENPIPQPIITKKPLPRSLDNACFSLPTWISIMALSLPSILQNSTVSIGQLFVQSLVNSFGNANLVAAYGSAFKINYIIISVFLTISNAMATFTSQNIGAHKLDRAKQGLKGGVVSMLVLAAVCTALYLLLAKQLVSLFISGNNQEIISIGAKFLYILSPFYVVVCIKIIFDGFVRGAGDMAGFTTSTMTDLIVRVGLSYLFVKALKLGYESIWWSWPIGWVVGATVIVIFYFSKRWVKTAQKNL